jgi:hypothetical protein
MQLFHGGIEIIKQPIIIEQQRLLDFGKGFYATSSQIQAERWACIKRKRVGDNAKAIVNIYHTDDNLLQNTRLRSHIFSDANDEWLDFIMLNRNNDTPHGFDLVYGPVANDTLYQTLTLFEAGLLTKPETITRLKVHRLFDQFSFHSASAIQMLTFVRAYEVEDK